jgi:Cu/Ag efflux protein CusF
MRVISSLFLATAFSLMLFGMGDECMAQQGHGGHEGHGVASATTSGVEGKAIAATGTVKSIAANHESIRIFHDPIPALKWPAMNMEFTVKDHDLTHALEVGDKVKFEFIPGESGNIIVKIGK